MRKFLTYLLCLTLAVASALDVDARRPRRRTKTKTAQSQTVSRKPERTARSIKAEKQQTQKEITETKRKLSANEKKTQQTLDKLNDLRYRISRQEVKIKSLSDSITDVESRIAVLDDSVAHMESDAKVLRDDLKETLRSMRQRRHSINDIAFVFSAPNFTAALRRVNYIRQLNAWRTAKIKRLKEQITRINEHKKQLDALKASHAGMLSSVNAERQTLTRRQSEEQQTVTRLRGESKELNVLLRRKKERANALDRELDRIIAEEARRAEEARKAEAARKAKAEAERKKREQEKRAQEKADAEKDKTPKSEKDRTKTDEKDRTAPKAAEQKTAEAERRLGGNFAANRGNLLFPVAGKYTIVSAFGRSKHRDIANVDVNNSGVDIGVAAGTKARAVFDGTVSSIFVMPGYQNIIIVRHGSYLTVYAGITGVSVSKGANVRAGQTLGTVYSDPDNDNRTVLHFEVRHERQKLNPLEWVR